MALKDLIPQPETLKFPKGELTVYPLTMKDVIVLLQRHSVEMGQLMEGKVDLSKLISEAPAFVANLITISAHESEDLELVAQLPFSVQLIALQAIWDISAVDGDMLGKLVLRLAEGMTKLNAQLRVQSAGLVQQSVE